MNPLSQALGCALAVIISGCILGSAASAQNQDNPFVPPVYNPVDENRVNLTTGIVSRSLTTLTVGNGPSALTRSVSFNPFNRQDNYYGSSCPICEHSRQEGNVFGPGFSKTLFSDGTPIPNTGDSYNGNVRYDSEENAEISAYIARDGTEYEFVHPLNGDGIRRNRGILRKIIKPNGEIISVNTGSIIGFLRETVFESVSNNYGFMIKNTINNNNLPNSYVASVPVNLSIHFCDRDSVTPCSGLDTTRQVNSRTLFAPNSTYFPVVEEEVQYPIVGSAAMSLLSETSAGGLSRTFENLTSGYWYGMNMAEDYVCPNLASFCMMPGNFRVNSAGRTITYTIAYGAVTAWRVNSTRTGINSYSCYYGVTLTRVDALNGTRVIKSCGEAFYGTNVVSVLDESGQTTRYAYDINHQLEWVQYPEGNATRYTYDARANVIERRDIAKAGFGLTDRVWTASYESACTNRKTCNQPTWVKDAKGNQTDYTYYAAHGGVETETAPADNGNVRKKTRYEYMPLYAQIKNSTGTLVNAEGPIYKLTKVSVCPATQSVCDQPGDTVTEYKYEHNNLLMTAMTVRASNANVANVYTDTNLWQTTTYGYDYVGNSVMIDGPLPDDVDRSYAVYDVLRRKVYEIGPDPDGAGPLKRQIVKHYYDGNHNEYKTETGVGSVIVFDGTVPTGVSDFAVTSFKETVFNPVTGLASQTTVGRP